jgi:PAS domain S-box-containing protein
VTIDLYLDSDLPAAEVSLDGRWLRVNPSLCKLLGYSQEELRQLRVREVTHPEDRAYSVTIVDRALRHHEQSQEEMKRYIHKDSTVVWVLLKTTLKRDDQGEPTHFLSFLEDVTQRVTHEPLARAMAKRLHTIQEQERQKIARELHNELGQVMSALKLELGWLQAKLPKKSQPRGQRLNQLVDSILASVRRLWTGLRPTILDELGLEPAIDWLLQENCGLNGIPWTLTPPDRPLSLDSQTRVSLFRFCQECVSLLLPAAQSIDVRLQRTQHHIGLTVLARSDAPAREEPSLALQELAHLVGGKLEWLTQPPQTTVRLRLPILAPSPDTRAVPPHWE